MEVHHHTQTPREKWTHYFWEFLMLFLAVLCGFLAENEREHLIENKREKNYIQSLINDLKGDTANLTGYISLRETKTKNMDSLIDLLISGTYKEKGSQTYFLARWLSRARAFIPTDGTMQQLKNAGGLRLISKHYLADSIIAYDRSVRLLENNDESDIRSQEKFKDIGGEIFRANIFYHIMDSFTAGSQQMIPPIGNPQLLTTDTFVINKIAFQIQYEASILKINIEMGTMLKIKASQLIELLKKEYKLK